MLYTIVNSRGYEAFMLLSDLMEIYSKSESWKRVKNGRS